MASDSVDLCARWAQTLDQDLTLGDIKKTLAPVEDDLWVVAACHDRLLNNVDVHRGLLDEGLKRSEPAKNRVLNLSFPSSDTVSDLPSTTGDSDDILVSYFKDEPVDAQILCLRALLLSRLDRLNTFVEITRALENGTLTQENGEGEWEDDPWGEEDGDIREEEAESSPPFELSRFVIDDLLALALIAASVASFPTLRILLKRHPTELWPHHFAILDHIPEHVHPSEYRDLLPVSEDPEITSQPWRAERDQLSQISSSLLTNGSDSGQLSSWYIRRVDRILEETGMADIALALIQHGASQGVPGLDELGEELSLMSRMVYRADEFDDDDDISLNLWRSMEPDAVVRAYLRHSTPETIVAGIRKLVLPYLFVLEARSERSGHPDRSIASRLLNDYILTAPLGLVAAVFEASKPTLPTARRLIRDDEEMVRLALACLYGNQSLSEWSTMSRIFECLPAWDVSEDTDNFDEGDTTVASLGAFVAPTTTRPQCSPQDLLIFFQPLHATSLSRILDILDVHLESGEILSRWNAPAPLRWLLQSMHDHAQQKSRATRMSRRHGGSEDHLDSLAEWEWLLEDMLKLTGTNDAGVPSAFGSLSRDEVIAIFFGGLLSTGKFAIAKSLLHSKKSPLGLKDETIEDICLAASREFYDNAGSGNYHFGDMKLAYDCLSVPSPSNRVQEERDFIEATSRITSFNVLSRPGMPITPIEIRLTKDRLSLVSRVLSSTSDAYKYPEVILDLVAKLGLRSDAAATVKALAMLADTALQSEDFTRAHDTAAQMVNTVLRLRAANDPAADEASEVCWVACFQLGRHPEFDDGPKKAALLGRALQLCPPEKLSDVLTAWRRLEADVLAQQKLARKTRGPGDRTTRPKREQPASLAARFKGIARSVGSVPSSPDPATIAQTFSRVAATFPFSIGGGVGRPRSVASVASDDSGSGVGRERERDGREERGAWTKLDHASEEVSSQASRALQKGIGWLIGADDE
ncbi:secretory pathway protein Sec39-domain-containing protein [Vararia minispora EC-137]|uniref:Secretory pathway protein Sec39-domain-containing protein n=1 Tax=Vararia minispora EC-137 TaxID=1314806 RepID=A0ACB8QQW4_9AGAM|nr:secretory pathway protein Sec39-domain-containing protein [Vararia minispora EC-137]